MSVISDTSLRPGRFSLVDKVRESNRIEGIYRFPTSKEVEVTALFLALERLRITDVQMLVAALQPGARLRDSVGLDVTVGDHVPPAGGVQIPYLLDDLLVAANEGHRSAWRIHREYENLHPFTDGNGRSGRAIWYWMMRGNRMADLGFLHAFYYQTLKESR
jgi:hypothetical protein